MYPCFEVEGIDVNKLLEDWRWLLSGSYRLVAINAFGDLFLEGDNSEMHWLDITGGTISVVASSVAEFQNSASSNSETWFLRSDEEHAANKGYRPIKGQCIGSKIPWIFRESTGIAENLRIADLYEYVGFMGSLHRQIAEVPNGGTVRIRFQPE